MSKRKGTVNGFFDRFKKHKLGIVGLTGVIIIMLVAIFAPYIAPEPTGYGNSADVLKPPTEEHIFGTDYMGLDVFAQVVWGTRASILVGFIAVFVSALIGVTIGLLSGYYGGLIETIGMGLADIFFTLPVLPLMIIMAAVMGSDIKLVALVIGLFQWPKLARVTRASTMRVINMQYITAAKSLGIYEYKIIFKHVLVNASAPILVNMTIVMAGAILSESGLSFLGLGDPLTWSWGKILNNAHQSGAFISAWWTSMFPSLAIMAFVISFNLFGMGIRDALNPRLNK